jgi:hypothetical protein
MIFFPIFWFVVFVGGWGLLLFIVHWIGKALQKARWAVVAKRTIYAASAALLLAPIFPIPIPSAALIVAFVLTPTAPVANRLWAIVPSFAVTFTIFWLIGRRKFMDQADSNHVADSTEAL